MIYVIANDRMYEMRNRLLVESDLPLPRVVELLKQLGPEYDDGTSDLGPRVLAVAPGAHWVEPGCRMALFDCEIWRLYDSAEQEWDNDDDKRRRALMDIALREESISVLELFREPPAMDPNYFPDRTVPTRAVAELARRKRARP